MTEHATHETTISADPDEPTITIIREFDAAPAAVFRAFTDPELFVQWIGPRSIDTEVRAWDASTGGRYSYLSRRGEEQFGFYGSFHEVRSPDRIVQTFSFEGFPDAVSLETMTLEELPGGRTRLTALSVVPSRQQRDQMLASGMEAGVREGYEQLDELLARD